MKTGKVWEGRVPLLVCTGTLRCNKDACLVVFKVLVCDVCLGDGQVAVGGMCAGVMSDKWVELKGLWREGEPFSSVTLKG